jgi:hypothetical protein
MPAKMHQVFFKLAIIQIAALHLLILPQPTFAQEAGFFLDEWQEKSAVIPDYKMVPKTGTPSSANINVDMGQEENKVPAYIFGNNAVTWDNGLRGNATAMKDLQNLDPHVLRWPGGNLSSEYFWNLAASQRPGDIPADMNPWYGQNTANWQMSVDEYYDLLGQTNSTGIICVNLSYARYGTGPDPVAKAAHMAAEWVRYDHGRSKFWELGNENFGNWEAGYQIDPATNQDGQPEYISGQLYGQHCRVFIDSMRAAAAETGVEIRIGVVAYDAENSYDPIQTNWNEGMMPEVGDLADFLIVHSYFTPYQENSTVSRILNSHVVPGEIMSVMVNDMAEAGKPMIPVAFTEWNIFAEGSMQQVSYINGMLSALVLGEFVRNDYGLGARWDLVNGWNNGNDHGMFATGEPGVDPYNPRPAFFYMYYFQKYFGDRMVHSTVSGNNNVVAFASSYSSGEAGLVIVNKSTSNETVSIVMDHFEPGKRYYYHTLTGGDDNGDFSRKVYINGYGTAEEGGGPDHYETIKAFASEIEGGIKVGLPSLSVVYLMVEKNPPLSYVSSKIDGDPSVISIALSGSFEIAESPAGFEVLANGSDLLTVTGIEADTADSLRLLILLDRDVLPGDEITLSYSGGSVISRDSVPLAPFSNLPVENLLPGAVPILAGAVTSHDGTMIFLDFHMGMQLSGPSAASFELTLLDETNRVIGISDVTIDDEDATKILIYPSESMFLENDLVLSYSGTRVMSTEGTLLKPFDAFPVTNEAPGIPPELLSASVPDPGFSLELLFTKSMMDPSVYGPSFTVKVNDEIRDIDTITSEGKGMTISLADYIRYGDFVTLSYEGTGVTSIDRGQLQVIDNFPVINALPEPNIIGIPGMIEAERFSVKKGMEVVRCADTGGGQNLAYIETGDWVDYEVSVLQTGAHRGTLRIATTSEAGLLVIQTLDSDQPVQDTVALPYTGGEQFWESVAFYIDFHEGRQRIRLTALTPGININWLNLEFGETGLTNVVGSQGFVFYPNPVHDRLTVESDGNNIISAEVVDLTGKRITCTDFKVPMQAVSMEITASPGVYVLKVKSENATFTAKLVIN